MKRGAPSGVSPGMQRATRQRAAIWEALADAEHPLDPSEVLRLAQRRVPRLGIATVYRCLNTLIDDGRLAAVDIPGRARQYERASLDHHHHFHCSRCGRTFDLKGCPLDGTPRVPRGFRVASHEVIVYGTCAGCR